MNIKAIRKKLQMSQPQFAREVGVTPRQVNRWEHDKSVPSQLARQSIERLLERSVVEAS